LRLDLHEVMRVSNDLYLSCSIHLHGIGRLSSSSRSFNLQAYRGNITALPKQSKLPDPARITSTRSFSSTTYSFYTSMTALKKRKGGTGIKESGSSSSSSSPPPVASKKSKTAVDATDYSPRQVSRLSNEYPIWPAPASTIAKAATFLKKAAKSNERILLIPDKDADGLSAGMIVKRTLIHLGAAPDLIVQHHIPAGRNPTSNDQRDSLESYQAKWVIVLDQGSPPAPALVSGAELGWESDDARAVRTMVLDHHFVTDLETAGPAGCLLLNACKFEPVSTSAVLAWVLCRPLWGQDSSRIDYLALIGNSGDLSINHVWDAPWPDFGGAMKKWGKSKLGQAVAMINAPRRTPMHDAIASWDALEASTNPLDILSFDTNPSFARLNEARRLVREETEKCTHTPPRFSKVSSGGNSEGRSNCSEERKLTRRVVTI
jgi:hypothetical protein